MEEAVYCMFSYVLACFTSSLRNCSPMVSSFSTSRKLNIRILQGGICYDSYINSLSCNTLGVIKKGENGSGFCLGLISQPQMCVGAGKKMFHQSAEGSEQISRPVKIVMNHLVLELSYSISCTYTGVKTHISEVKPEPR